VGQCISDIRERALKPPTEPPTEPPAARPLAKCLFVPFEDGQEVFGPPGTYIRSIVWLEQRAGWAALICYYRDRGSDEA